MAPAIRQAGNPPITECARGADELTASAGWAIRRNYIIPFSAGETARGRNIFAAPGRRKNKGPLEFAPVYGPLKELPLAIR